MLPKLQKPQTNVYNIAQIQNALAVADDLSTYLLILLGASVGLRRGEMAALQWKDVNLVKNTITICQSRVHTTQGILEKDPKTQAGKRTITIGHDVANALRDAKSIYDEAMTNNPGFKNLGYVLFKDNGEPFHPDSLTQKWERFIAKHHLSPIRLHDLRHSNATAMIAAGINAKVVQHRLGHANVSITLTPTPMFFPRWTKRQLTSSTMRCSPLLKLSVVLLSSSNPHRKCCPAALSFFAWAA